MLQLVEGEHTLDRIIGDAVLLCRLDDKKVPRSSIAWIEHDGEMVCATNSLLGALIAAKAENLCRGLKRCAELCKMQADPEKNDEYPQTSLSVQRHCTALHKIPWARS